MSNPTEAVVKVLERSKFLVETILLREFEGNDETVRDAARRLSVSMGELTIHEEAQRFLVTYIGEGPITAKDVKENFIMIGEFVKVEELP